MELRNWRIHFPVLSEYDAYHKDLGALSDFFARSLPGETLAFTSTCQAMGEIYGDPENEKGKEIRTGRVFTIRRLWRDASNCDYVISAEKSVYYVRYDSIDKKFLDEARTFGTPGIYPE